MARSEQFERNIRNFAHIFQTSTHLLEDHYASQLHPLETSIQHTKRLRDSLVQRMEMQLQVAKGHLKQYRYLNQVGALEAAEDHRKLAEKCHIAVLIYASAARKANRHPAGHALNRWVEQKILRTRETVLNDPGQSERLAELQRFIEVAEGRGWQRCDGDTRLITFIGATWCQDTVNVVEIMGCFGIPMHMLIMDEDNENEAGFLKFNDHALLIIKQDPEKDRLRVPVMIFPDGSRMIEPKPLDFMIELVKQKII